MATRPAASQRVAARSHRFWRPREAAYWTWLVTMVACRCAAWRAPSRARARLVIAGFYYSGLLPRTAGPKKATYD